MVGYYDKYAAGSVDYAKRQLDSVVTPQQRKEAYDSTAEFATARPFLFSFIVAQVLFSGLPVLLFVFFVASTLAFSLVAAILFSLFWIGVATIVLVPTLFVTVSIGFLFWAWLTGTFLVGRWVYAMLPAGVKGGGPEAKGTTANGGGKQVLFSKNLEVKGGGDADGLGQ